MHTNIIFLVVAVVSLSADAASCGYCSDGDACTVDDQHITVPTQFVRPAALLVLYDFPSDDPHIGALTHSLRYSTMPDISTLCGTPLTADCTPPFAGGALSPIPESAFPAYFHWSATTIRFATALDLHQTLPSKTWTLTVDSPLDDVGYGAPDSFYHNADFTAVLAFAIVKGTKLPGTTKNVMVQCFDTCWIYVESTRAAVISTTKVLSSGHTVKFDADAVAGPSVGVGQVYVLRVFYVSRYSIVNVVSVAISSSGVHHVNCTNTVIDSTICKVCTSDSQCTVPAGTSPCTIPRCDVATHRCTIASVPAGTPCTTTDPCAAAGNAGQCLAGSCIALGHNECDDGNNCTRDSCNQQTGACTHVVIPNCGNPPTFCECLHDDDCGESTVCKTYTCTPQHRCISAIHAGIPCGPCQLCSNNGSCVSTCTETDCAMPSGCAEDGQQCLYTNKNVDCQMPGDGAPGHCRLIQGTLIPVCAQCDPALGSRACTPLQECAIGTCLETYRCNWLQYTDGMHCRFQTDKVCLGGVCVECLTADTCPHTDCQTPVCDANHDCQTTQLPDGTACPGGTTYCVSGTCMPCAFNENCPPPTEQCRISVCTVDHTCTVQLAPPLTPCFTAGQPGVCREDGFCIGPH
jgi:hypothetical protein